MQDVYSAPPMFQWRQQYAVNVEEIDHEHQGLFAAAERMHQAMLAGLGKQVLQDLLAKLVSYTCVHFAHEEQLMERVGYPGLNEHRAQHLDLRSRLELLRKRAAAGEVTMTIEVAQFLIEWLKQHTATSDLRIAGYVTSDVKSRLSPLPEAS